MGEPNIAKIVDQIVDLVSRRSGSWDHARVDGRYTAVPRTGGRHAVKATTGLRQLGRFVVRWHHSV
jgi:hypothetical protein